MGCGRWGGVGVGGKPVSAAAVDHAAPYLTLSVGWGRAKTE